jgi:hypothetical protein
VTHILQTAGLGPDFSMVPVAVLEKARGRGAAVHALIEAHAYKYLDEADITDEVRPYFEAYLRFLKESGHESVLSEFKVQHPTWHYVGHPDRIGWLCGKRCLLDWKCVDSLDLVPVEYQLAGYKLAWDAERPLERIDIAAAVQLMSDGKYRLHELEPEKVEHIFLAACTVWWARKDMGR